MTEEQRAEVDALVQPLVTASKSYVAKLATLRRKHEAEILQVAGMPWSGIARALPNDFTFNTEARRMVSPSRQGGDAALSRRHDRARRPLQPVRR